MLITGQEELRPADSPIAGPSDKKNDRRMIQRISLPLPVRVEVKIDAKVGWNEITRLSDVSAFGAGFTLKRPLKRGRMVFLTIPMPRQLRMYDHAEPQYKLWAVIRRCISTGNNEPEYAVGVAFTGKTPPAGYLQDPSMLFDVSDREDGGEGFWRAEPTDPLADDSHLPTDLRKQTRFDIPESVKLEKVDENGNVLESETTVTENISLGGAAVFTTLKADPGTFMRVTSERFNITILAIVRESRIGENGVTRLHLEFVDSHFPLEGIE
jgi:hypothetical protein